MENQSLTLKERSTGLIATASNPEKIRELERSLTIEKIVKESLPLVTVLKNCNPGDVERTIDIQLTRLVGSLNLKWSLQPAQISQIVEDLVDKYQYESIEDFILIFKRARQGEFGELYRLDSAVIFGWMERYLDEKYSVLERLKMREKANQGKTIFEDISPETEEKVKQFADGLKEAAKKIPEMTHEEIRKWGQSRPPKSQAKSAGYQIIDPQEDLRELKRQYGLTYHDLYTGEKLPNWISWEDYLLLNNPPF